MLISDTVFLVSLNGGRMLGFCQFHKGNGRQKISCQIETVIIHEKHGGGGQKDKHHLGACQKQDKGGNPLLFYQT